jgi:hypothetical protein
MTAYDHAAKLIIIITTIIIIIIKTIPEKLILSIRTSINFKLTTWMLENI